jgi:hypothetical protein
MLVATFLHTCDSYFFLRLRQLPFTVVRLRAWPYNCNFRYRN